MCFDINFIKSTLSDCSFINSINTEDPSFSIDSRTLTSGDIFVALKGAHVDGHDFIGDALTNGAVGLIIAQESKNILDRYKDKLDSIFVLIVPSPEEAFLKLASAWRAQFSYPVVGITGSVGKTSTKAMTHAILSRAEIPHVVSAGNQNTPLGLALNLFKMRSYHKAAIFEVGISLRGEMKILAQMLVPTTGVITAIGHAHMEGLGSMADIAYEKRQLFSYFKEDSIGIINGDQLLLSQCAYSFPVIKFGSKTINQVQARKVKYGSSHVNFVLKLYKNKYMVKLSQSHEGAVSNALAAATVCYFLQVDSKVIVAGLEGYQSVEHRFETKPLTRFKGSMIDDAYNANPESMKASLIAFQHLSHSGKKIAVLGDMFELGISSAFWHRQLGRFLRKVPSLDHVILVGTEVVWTQKTIPVTLNVERVSNWQEAITLLEKHLSTEATVLVKGSRGMALDNLIAHFTK